MADAKYQVGEIIHVFNSHLSKLGGPQLAEVLGYTMMGQITYLTYRELSTGAQAVMPLLFEDHLTKSAGSNARLIYGKT